MFIHQKQKCMKKCIMVFSLMAAIVLVEGKGYAQPPAPRGPGPNPLPPADNRAPRPPDGPESRLQTVTAFEGKVSRLTTNADYVYDGFYLLSGTDSFMVRFPAHLGTRFVEIVRPGQSVTVNGSLRVVPLGEKEIEMISVTAGGHTINNLPPDNTTVPVSDIYTTGNGKISGVQTDPDGRVNGWILDNDKILRLPPNVMGQLNMTTQTGVSVAFTGMEKKTQPGEAVSSSYAIIRCQTITVNGQQYLVR
jgi:hypothetical protein